MLTKEQCDFFWDQGYLHIPQVFTPAETDALSEQLDSLLQDWATTSQGWSGPWRRAYMDAATEAKSKLIALHDLHFYAEAWMRGVTKPNLVEAMSDLLGPNVELHHTTLHIKPPETGHPFPMHQDSPFYQHSTNKFVACLVHLDDTCHANGEIRFLPGSHKVDHMQHVLKNPDGTSCTPHLPTNDWSLENTVPVPAKRGDIVCFNIYTVHGSYINTTDKMRRLVRVGYRDPLNKQMAGQSNGRPGIMVRGVRPNPTHAPAFTTDNIG